MSHRDPQHLPRPVRASLPYACTHCGEGSVTGFDRRTKLGDERLCTGCHWRLLCKCCSKAVISPLDDHYCAQCFSAWLSRHPDELADMRARLESSEEGRAVLREVVVGYERASAECEANKLLIAQGMRRIAREARVQHYRAMAEQLREEA